MSHGHEASDPMFVPLRPGHLVGQAGGERKDYGQISQTERYERRELQPVLDRCAAEKVPSYETLTRGV